MWNQRRILFKVEHLIIKLIGFIDVNGSAIPLTFPIAGYIDVCPPIGIKGWLIKIFGTSYRDSSPSGTSMNHSDSDNREIVRSCPPLHPQRCHKAKRRYVVQVYSTRSHIDSAIREGCCAMAGKASRPAINISKFCLNKFLMFIFFRVF